MSGLRLDGLPLRRPQGCARAGASLAPWARLLVTLLILALIGPAGADAASAPVGPARASAVAPLAIGFYDTAFTGPDAATWLGRAASSAADVVRINIGWVAPNTQTSPPGFHPENPADPNYDFGAADTAVETATADGLRVILDFTGAPRWAEGGHMPRDATPGSWRPDPAAVKAYAVALARRYSGHFSDPTNPLLMLPRVWAFQLWNEPNLPEYLEPQWVGGRATAPIIYRAMLNAFYAGIKSVDPHALVVTAGTAPFGDPGTSGRISPALFWRDVLCVRQVGTQLEGERCADPAHFDVLAHHPYSVGAPATKALNPDDVSIPDIGKLTRILRFAERTGGALPREHHPIWVTEVGYNTDPPNPQGVPVRTAARWLAQTLELLWAQGVSLITWNLIGDQPPDPSYSETSQSGIYYVNGSPKAPLVAAFGFPVVATRTGSTVAVWGRSPARGRLLIERQTGSGWGILATLHVNVGNTFLTHFVDTSPVTVRALIGTDTSLPWNLR